MVIYDRGRAGCGCDDEIIATDPDLFVGDQRFQGKYVRRRINRFRELLFSNAEPGAVNFEPFFLQQFGRTFMAQVHSDNFTNFSVLSWIQGSCSGANCTVHLMAAAIPMRFFGVKNCFSAIITLRY